MQFSLLLKPSLIKIDHQLTSLISRLSEAIRLRSQLVPLVKRQPGEPKRQFQFIEPKLEANFNPTKPTKTAVGTGAKAARKVLYNVLCSVDNRLTGGSKTR